MKSRGLAKDTHREVDLPADADQSWQVSQRMGGTVNHRRIRRSSQQKPPLPRHNTTNMPGSNLAAGMKEDFICSLVRSTAYMRKRLKLKLFMGVTHVLVFSWRFAEFCRG